VSDLAAALTEMVADPERAQRLGQAGRQRAADHFSWESIAERTLDVYRGVLS
jgi:starch synthase